MMNGESSAVDALCAPQAVGEVTAAYLAPLLTEFLSVPRMDVHDVRIRALRQGTSGSRFYRIAVRTPDPAGSMSLLLKVDKPGEITEALFYQQLRELVPVGTPRILDARVLHDGRGWVLMEELRGAKSGLRWTRQDARAVVRDMAKLHAANWGNGRIVEDFPWLPRPDAAVIADQIADMRSCVQAIERAGLTKVLPEVLSVRRLRLVEAVLDRAQDVLGPLLDPGLTLVHGDYWFHNVQLLPDGRRVLLDWQTCRVFSGVWELVYFLDLWHVLGKRSFRDAIPETQTQVAAWYVESLREHGIELPDDAFREALACASIWHPMTHWLTRYGRIAKNAEHASAWRAARRVPVAARFAASALASAGALRHMASTWARWEQSAEARF